MYVKEGGTVLKVESIIINDSKSCWVSMGVGGKQRPLPKCKNEKPNSPVGGTKVRAESLLYFWNMPHNFQTTPDGRHC